MLKICAVVRDKKPAKSLDLINSKAILEHLAKWRERMCQVYLMDSGSEATQLRQQQRHLYDEYMLACATACEVVKSDG